jgi:hypothetical protein
MYGCGADMYIGGVNPCIPVADDLGDVMSDLRIGIR